MSLLDQEIVAKPFPSRGASQALRDRLLVSLMKHRPQAGEPFPSDAELAKHSGLSRMTVRKALDGLHREGWIDRQAGRGTFVGPRINAPLTLRPTSPANGGGPGVRVRMAVTVYDFANFHLDWYTPHVLAGVDEVAEAHGVIVELLGDRDKDIAAIGRRLASSQPDVLAMIAPAPWNRPIVGLAQQARIPVIATGTSLTSVGVPTVAEDGAQGAAAAVKYLVERGHTRIGYISKPDLAPWVFYRREGYLKAMTDAGLPADENMVFWPSYDPVDGFGRARHEQFDAYLQKAQPTAAIFCSSGEPDLFKPLLASGRLSIPRDLSLIGFDQDPQWVNHLGVNPVTVTLPFREMGRRLATMARAIVEGRPAESSVVPCELREGDSVRDLRA